MLFNSLDFAVFLPIVFALYWFVTNQNLKLQNALIVAASYVFYGWWDWRFLSLIIFSTLVDYSIGRRLKNDQNQFTRKILLWTSVIVNLGLLGFFKYYNFFVENFVAAFSFFGQEIQPNTLNIILPVGISFYTFQTLSYTIDVYKKKLEPTEDFIAFSAFVSFFPQLVAGPIERATNLLPQFYKKRSFEYDKAVDGMRQILWGLFKKVVIADNCAEYANLIFINYEDYNGSTLLLGVIFFAFQVYGDFSGYSDIAIGTSRLFGFNLMKNFATPYFSRNIVEFWRRWHISLSTWLTDYLFTPLAINLRHHGRLGMGFAIVFTFFISGLWHGAGWNFIVYGLLNGVYFIITMWITKGKSPKGVVAQNNVLPSLWEICQISLTFILVSFSYIFFRSESIDQATNYSLRIFTESPISLPVFKGRMSAAITVIFVFGLIIIEWINRGKVHSLMTLPKNKIVRYVIYYILVICIFMNSASEQEFIYFQF
jgi:alginate O-acetyltransferase complex protein AlgI